MEIYYSFTHNSVYPLITDHRHCHVWFSGWTYSTDSLVFLINYTDNFFCIYVRIIHLTLHHSPGFSCHSRELDCSPGTLLWNGPLHMQIPCSQHGRWRSFASLLAFPQADFPQGKGLKDETEIDILIRVMGQTCFCLVLRIIQKRQTALLLHVC